MIAITVEFLAGVAFLDGRAAGQPGQPEWPPHPDRIYMAMVAAWGRGGCRGSEQSALEWLEQQSPPAISSSDCEMRPRLKLFSPVNDRLPQTKKIKIGLSEVSREHRGRHLVDYFRGARNKERHVSSVVPDSSRVSFIWQADAPDDVRQSLNNIAGRLTYLGSSESVVTSWLDESPPQATWVPQDDGQQMMRVPYGGRLRDLQADYDAGAGPTSAGWTDYSQVNAAEYSQGEWSHLLPYELVGPVDFRHTVRLARAVRSCLLAACPDSIPPWVSGHSADGDCLRDSHVAVVPLANVGHEHGDGRVLGVGLMLPQRVSIQERRHCLGNLCTTPKRVSQHVCIQRVESPRATLDYRRWTRPSCSWGTVTPIACHRWPKRGDVVSVLRRDIEQAGLPAPEHIEVRKMSPFNGRLFDEPFDAPKKYRTHAAIHWNEPVAGPVAIGAGRYLGMGFCGRLS